MKINTTTFGQTENGETVELYTLTNNNGSFVKITNFGGIITDIQVPDKNGWLTNVVLGFDNLEDYFSDSYKKLMPYFGAIIGRYGNRIANGQFEIEGIKYKVPCNLPPNALHGGLEGFNKKVWTAKTEVHKTELRLSLNYVSPHLEEGFPGELSISVTYSWNNENELQIEYSATTDQATHINFTNHSYFNLNGGIRDILDTELEIASDHYTEVNKFGIPTGRLIAVDKDCMDFRTPHKIGARIKNAQGIGYDHNYVISAFDGSLISCANAFDPLSGIKMVVLTTKPGVQLFTANHLDGSISRGQIAFTKHMGFCLETQHFPDTLNQKGFPTTLLKPGELFESKTVYKFSAI